MRPILRLATRTTRRTRWTAWGIAVACMVLVGSLSLVDGLSAGVDSATSRFASGPTVYLHGTDLVASAIDETSLVAIPTDFSVLRARPAALNISGVLVTTVVASLTEYHGSTTTVPFPSTAQEIAIDTGLAGEIENASGQPLGATANLTALGVGPVSLEVAPPPGSRPALFPSMWAWVRPDLLIGMNPIVGGPVQAVLTPSPLDPALAARLGLTPLQTVGAAGFAQASVAQAASVLLGLAGLVAVVIALLVANAMGVEVLQRSEEIRTLRSLGASPGVVAAVYEVQALVLALLGATVGSALGVVLVHGLVSFAPLVGFPNLVVLQAPVGPVLAAYGLALAVASLAGLIPAARAASLSRGGLEARPS